jgi:hypothetical protein
MLRRLSRRQLLAAMGALPVAGFVVRWLWRARTPQPAALNPQAAEAISRVCDRFIPSVDGRPGAVALQIDKKILRQSDRSQSPDESLAELGKRLQRDQFLSMTSDEQDAYLEERLFDREAWRPFHHLLDRCVEEFYTNPQSWVSLRYTKPQPEGHPDYARCG